VLFDDDTDMESLPKGVKIYHVNASPDLWDEDDKNELGRESAKEKIA